MRVCFIYRTPLHGQKKNIDVNWLHALRIPWFPCPNSFASLVRYYSHVRELPKCNSWHPYIAFSMSTGLKIPELLRSRRVNASDWTMLADKEPWYQIYFGGLWLSKYLNVYLHFNMTLRWHTIKTTWHNPMKTSLHRNASNITGHLWGKPQVCGGFPPDAANYAEFVCFLCFECEQTTEKQAACCWFSAI